MKAKPAALFVVAVAVPLGCVFYLALGPSVSPATPGAKPNGCKGAGVADADVSPTLGTYVTGKCD